MSRVVAAVFLLLFVISTAAYAQNQTGRLILTVNDTTGGALPTATVTVTGLDTANRTVKLTGQTTASGIVIFDALAPGRYTAVAEFSGFESSPPREVRVRAGDNRLTITLDAATQAITLGRDEHNDVVIREKLASRLHARIERRHDKFALVDSSVNGTYVTFEGEREFLLHRQELLFKGRGRISFGRPLGPDAGDVVSFVCSDAPMTDPGAS